jgi:predicted outer membrane repeat protein
VVLHSQAKVVKLARKSIFRSYICPVLMFHLRYHLRNCTFDNNVATSSAGAIIIGGQAIVDLDGAVFTNNEATNGGAIQTTVGSQLYLTNAKFIGNSAS